MKTARVTDSLLFLCTGNYYRSRFADILFNYEANRIGLPWKAWSRGLALERGINNVGPMAASAIQFLQTLNIDSEEFSRFPIPVTAQDFETAQMVIALKEEEHLPLLQERFPLWVGKVDFWHVDDADGALVHIEQEMQTLLTRLKQ